MTLPSGTGDVRFTDVAKRIDPTTVAFSRCPIPPARVIEQNYQYDLVDNAKLLDRYIGQTISVEQVRGDKAEVERQAALRRGRPHPAARQRRGAHAQQRHGNIQFRFCRAGSSPGPPWWR